MNVLVILLQLSLKSQPWHGEIKIALTYFGGLRGFLFLHNTYSVHMF
jgi:hypothetical protein